MKTKRLTAIGGKKRFEGTLEDDASDKKGHDSPHHAAGRTPAPEPHQLPCAASACSIKSAIEASFMTYRSVDPSLIVPLLRDESFGRIIAGQNSPVPVRNDDSRVQLLAGTVPSSSFSPA